MFLDEADIRLVALVAIVVSLAAGYWLPFWALILITLIVIVIRSALLEEAKHTPAEGGIGYEYAAIGLLLTILAPMWLAFIISFIF